MMIAAAAGECVCVCLWRFVVTTALSFPIYPIELNVSNAFMNSLFDFSSSDEQKVDKKRKNESNILDNRMNSLIRFVCSCVQNLRNSCCERRRTKRISFDGNQKIRSRSHRCSCVSVCPLIRAHLKCVCHNESTHQNQQKEKTQWNWIFFFVP